MKKTVLTTLCTALSLLLLSSCSNTSATVSTSGDGETTTVKETMVGVLSTELFTDENAKEINLNEAQSPVEITAPGVYALSGKLQGQIIVNTADEGKVKLIFNGAEILNGNGACLYVKNADKVILSSNKDSVNILSSTGEFQEVDGDNVDATVFSHDDLTINGEGTISFLSSYGHSVVSKDEIKIKSGTIHVVSEKKGISGKDSIEIEGGTLDIISGTNCLDSEGDIVLSGGEISLYSNRKNGIHADGNFSMSDGSVKITNCKEGIEALTITISGGVLDITSEDDGLNAFADSETDTSLQIGANQFLTDDGADITISGGSLRIDAGEDGIDSNGTLIIGGGDLWISASTQETESAIDAANEALLNGGEILALDCSKDIKALGGSSAQPSIVFNLEKSYEQGTEVSLINGEGVILLSYTAPKTFSRILASTPELEQGQTYTLTVGEDTFDVQTNG